MDCPKCGTPMEWHKVADSKGLRAGQRVKRADRVGPAYWQCPNRECRHRVRPGEEQQAT